MEPLKGGRLAKPKSPIKEIFETDGKSRTPVQWALDWVWDIPEVTMLLSGMSTLSQVKQNIEYAQMAKPYNLTKVDREFVSRIEKTFHEIISVDCSDCKYCMPCPSGVNIPLNFEFYNDLRFLSVAHAKKLYEQWIKEENRAKKCTQCGLCEDKCPQQIKIITELKKVAKTFR
jgi:predicted aldo/keto reductase-like oxidoreductase